jgi:hypothetical protein
MKPSFLQSVLLVVVLAFAASVCGAQASGSESGSGQAKEDLHGLHVVQVPVRPLPTPFPLDVHTGRVQELEFRAPEAMTAADRELAASAQVEIERRAELQGFRGVGGAGQAEMEPSKDGGWGFEQAVCPVFPQHLILEYSRSNGAGDVTLFSVAVPRGEGHVRVIPVRRRSYSLWTPASSNALTLNDFNYMVKEGGQGVSPDWLTLSLCYAALAGGHVRAALIAGKAADEVYPLLAPAKLAVSWKGGAEVYFADSTPGVKPLQWSLTFSRSGRLLKAGRTGPRELVERPIKGNAAEVAGVPMKESTVDLGKPAK